MTTRLTLALICLGIVALRWRRAVRETAAWMGPGEPAGMLFEEYGEFVPMAAWTSGAHIGYLTGRRYNLNDRDEAAEALLKGDATYNDLRRVSIARN